MIRNLIKIRQISNFWERRGNHTTPATLPRTGVGANFHGQIIQDNFFWLQDIRWHDVSV